MSALYITRYITLYGYIDYAPTEKMKMLDIYNALYNALYYISVI